MKSIKVPRDWVYCTKCDKMYSFIRCRVTLMNPRRNVCLTCAVETEKHGTLNPLPVRQLSMDEPEDKVEEAPVEEAETPAEATEAE